MRTVIGVLPTVPEAKLVHEKEITIMPAVADKRELKTVERSKRSNAAAARAGALRDAVLGLLPGGLMLSAPV